MAGNPRPDTDQIPIRPRPGNEQTAPRVIITGYSDNSFSMWLVGLPPIAGKDQQIIEQALEYRLQGL